MSKGYHKNHHPWETKGWNDIPDCDNVYERNEFESFVVMGDGSRKKRTSDFDETTNCYDF